jgi:hypothetical protein
MQGLPSFVPGFRLIDGSDLNQLVSAINSINADWYVGGPSASDFNAGTTPQSGFGTFSKALSKVSSGQVIGVLPGTYDEIVTISRSLSGISIIGLGGLGSAAIAPSGANDTGITNHADDMLLVNIGGAGLGTGTGIVNTGSRLRCVGCKFENDDGTGLAAQMTLGTVAQIAAGTRGKGSDCSLVGCEFAWAASGLQLSGTDFGAVTELQVVNGWFHDLATSHISEAVGSGGAAGVMFNSIRIQGNTFQTDEAGSQPTNYILLNGANTNTGIVCGNFFPTALNAGLNLVSTALLWVGNLHPAGLSTTQPS